MTGAPRWPYEPPYEDRRGVATGAEPAVSPAPPTGRTRRAWFPGMALLAVSVLFPAAAVLVVPFLPLSSGQKAGAIAALLVAGEAAFWLAALVLGREAVRRYRRFLSLRFWLGKR